MSSFAELSGCTCKVDVSFVPLTIFSRSADTRKLCGYLVKAIVTITRRYSWVLFGCYRVYWQNSILLDDVSEPCGPHFEWTWRHAAVSDGPCNRNSTMVYGTFSDYGGHFFRLFPSRLGPNLVLLLSLLYHDCITPLPDLIKRVFPRMVCELYGKRIWVAY